MNQSGGPVSGLRYAHVGDHKAPTVRGTELQLKSQDGSLDLGQSHF